MTAVQCRHIGQPEPFGYRDNRGVGGSQRKTLIRIHQVGHPRKVGARQVDVVNLDLQQKILASLVIQSKML